MKRNIVFLSLGLLILAMACKKKTGTSYTPSCSGDAPKFSTEVSAIIAAECGTSGCHNSGSRNGPGALVTHAQISASSSSIRSEVVSGRMPNDHVLSDARRNSIVCWIDAGAKND